MSTDKLQERVERLERELIDIKSRLDEPPRNPHPRAWLRTVGIFRDDPGFAEIIRKGREYRESQPYPEDV